MGQSAGVEGQFVVIGGRHLGQFSTRFGWRVDVGIARNQTALRGERGWKEGLQDKSNASGSLLTCCLHIVFGGGCAPWGGGKGAAACLAIGNPACRHGR